MSVSICLSGSVYIYIYIDRAGQTETDEQHETRQKETEADTQAERHGQRQGKQATDRGRGGSIRLLGA